MSFLARFIGSTPRIPLRKVPKENVILYTRQTPFWARWVLVLVALDTMVTTSMMEYTWFHWGTMEPKTDTPNNVSAGDTEEMEFVPRPYSVRSVACFMHFATGCGVAGALLATRSRIVRSIHLTPVSKTRSGTVHDWNVLVQTASMPIGKGALWPVKPCKFVINDSKSHMQLQTPTHGRFPVDLKGAEVREAKRGTVAETYDELLKNWRTFGGTIVPAKSMKEKTAKK